MKTTLTDTAKDRRQIDEPVTPRVVLMAHRLPGDNASAATPGLLMYNPEGFIEYSHNGQWYQVHGTPPDPDPEL